MLDKNKIESAVAAASAAFFGSCEKFDRVNSGSLFDKTTADLELLRNIQRTRRAAPTQSEDSRLVQRCKSPTVREILREHAENEHRAAKKAAWDAREHKSHEIKRLYERFGESQPIDIQRIFSERDYSIHHEVVTRIDKETGEVLETNADTKAPTARIYHREWSDEYRIRVEVQTALSEPPEPNAGERETKALNGRAASKIMDSGAYVQAVRGGFTTFLTLTFATDARNRIISGESTIGSEVSRFFDAAKKMYQRGFSMNHEPLKTVNGYQCIGAECVPEDTAHDDEFDYIWCAEMPENKDGQPNPHCHVLLRWGVPEYLFHDWAYRIEKLWGHGFAKLERIRDANAASGYLLKALGYVTKGAKKDQGIIRGNRYNISKSARAPKWECIASFYADNMTAIINELRDRWRWEDAPKKARIAADNEALAQKKRAYMIARKQKRTQTADKLKARLQNLTEQIKNGWQQIKQRQARADEYQITMKGDERLTKFLTWAVARRNWRAVEPENPYLGQIDRQQKIEWIKAARRKWRKASEWAGFLWFNTTHTIDRPAAGTYDDWDTYQKMEQSWIN